jgi:nitrogen fixation NifU-like protein
MYSPLVVDHFKHPRNVGAVAEATARGRAANPGCGDVVELSLRVEEGTIREARFRAAGCVPTIACASRLTELLLGITVSEARGIGRDTLVEAVGGVPDASRHAAQLSVAALRLALGTNGASSPERRGREAR